MTSTNYKLQMQRSSSEEYHPRRRRRINRPVEVTETEIISLLSSDNDETSDSDSPLVNEIEENIYYRRNNVVPIIDMITFITTIAGTEQQSIEYVLL